MARLFTQTSQPARRLSTLSACIVAGSLAAIPAFGVETAKPKPAAVAKPIDAAAPAAPATAAVPDAAAPSAAAEFQVVTQLKNAGVKTCLQTAQGLGGYTMGGVTEYAAATTWNVKQPDQRISIAMIAQKFGKSAAAPLGVSSVFSAPNADGKCDGAGVQVIPTTLACSAVQAQILQKGKQIADLATIPMLQDANNARIMLLPSAGNGCVIVGFNNLYAE